MIFFINRMCTWPFVLLSHVLSPRCRRRLTAQACAARGVFFWTNGGANESSVSPFPRNLAGSRASFPPDSVKSPKIPMLTSLLYKPSWPASPASHFPSLPVAYLICFCHNRQWHRSVIVAQPLRRHQRIAPAGRLHHGGGTVPGVV